jgi:hypothetical protein
MPEIKNTFLKGKMNKSLDDRLLPNGEYRDALNVQITKNESDGADIGALHNVKSNELVHTTLGLSSSYDVIGAFFDDKNNTIYYFVTNSSTSHRIYKYTPGGQPTIIVSGSWLNFDKQYPVIGVNVLENYLFWTDNNNQPRRINVDLANNTYYDSEDKVSVAKYAPYAPPLITSMSSQESIVSREIEEKFVRFAYRYKFEDNTYSLISPFSPVAFAPKDGNIDNNVNVSIDDENNIFGTSEYEGMVNGINQVDLSIDVPSDLNISHIDILYKESDSPAIRIVETKKATEASNGSLTYSYKSTLPKSTLPERQLTRVFDNVPVKALAQEVIANRIVYGNIQLGHDLDDQICDYDVFFGPKESTTLSRHSIKQRRAYEVGIIFSDRYGRTSPVILSENSTIYVSPKDDTFNNSTFLGDALKIVFKPVATNVAVKNAWHETNNPLGWYSYKIVIKQADQEYYNVYTSGILNYNKDYIELINSNVNKVPRDSSNYNLENDKIASSEVKLYPKVVNVYNNPSAGGDYAKSILSNDGLISIAAIGLPTDLGLKTDTTSAIGSMYNAADNPLMARLSTIDLGVTANNFFNKLAVFETEPIKSSLDIYYETPTCGLVSELNDGINDIILSAISLNSTDDTDLEEDFSESVLLGNYVATLHGFYDDDQSNKVLLNNGVTFEITQSNGDPLTTPNSDFEVIYDASDNKYKIRTKSNFVFDATTASNNEKQFYVTGSFGGVDVTSQVTLNITNAPPTVTFNNNSITISNNSGQGISNPSSSDAIATFTYTDGSAIGYTGVTSVIYSETDPGDSNHLNVLSIVDNQNGSGYVYISDSHNDLQTHSDGTVLTGTITVSDGTATGTADLTINITSGSIVGSGDSGATIQYYKASWTAFDNSTQACAASTDTSVWEEVTIYYSGTDEPMDITNPGTLYTDAQLTTLAPSGWYKSTAGSVGKWLQGSSTGAWVDGPTSCTQ